MNQTKQDVILMKKTKKLRIYYFDYLSIFCSFSVISIHVCGNYYNLDINSYKWKIAYFYNAFSRLVFLIFL